MEFAKQNLERIRASVEQRVGHLEPAAGMIAVCGAESLGIITSDKPQLVHYTDGNSAIAWVGVKLHPNPGEPWSSRSPIVVASLAAVYSEEIVASDVIEQLRNEPNLVKDSLDYIMNDSTIKFAKSQTRWRNA